MKKILSLLLICSLALSSTACSSNKKGADKIQIVLDWTPNTNHTGLYVAEALGYFADAGLNVEIMQPPEGSTTALIGAGGAQFGISFQDELAANFASEHPMPITVVAAIIQHNTSGVASLKKLGIDRPVKLEGHNYATWGSPIELAIIEKIMTDDGGDFSKLELIPNSVSDVITALQTDLDSVWIYYAWDGIAAKLAGLETNFLKFADYGKELDYYSPVIIGNNNYIKNHPEETKKLLEAVKKGYEYAIDHPEEAAQILVDAVPELDAELIKESQIWLASQYKADVEQWGYIDPTRWDLFYQWLYDNKLIERKIEPGAGFTNEYLSK